MILQVGDTALHQAIRKENLKSIEVLAEIGADLYARNNVWQI
jgi:ankyrin repeat protein